MKRVYAVIGQSRWGEPYTMAVFRTQVSAERFVRKSKKSKHPPHQVWVVEWGVKK